jgi:hypothetical protein
MAAPSAQPTGCKLRRFGPDIYGPLDKAGRGQKYDIFIHVVFIFHLFTIGHFGEIFKLLDALLCQAASLIKHSWLVFHRSQVRKNAFDSS